MNECLETSEICDVRDQFLIKLEVRLLIVNFLVQVNCLNREALVKVPPNGVDHCGLVVTFDFVSWVVVSLGCCLLPAQ